MSFPSQQLNTNLYRFTAPMAQMTPPADSSTNETNNTGTSVSTPHLNNQSQSRSNSETMTCERQARNKLTAIQSTPQPTNRHFNHSISLAKNESLNQTANSPTHQPPTDFSSPFLPPVTLTPAPPPPSSPPATTNAQIAYLLSNLLTHVLQSNPHLLPSSPPTTTTRLTSTPIDDIAHAMWNVAFAHGDLLQRACQYGAMFSPLKLAALAKLNFLPSWWFFRDLAVKGLQERGCKVDDAEMEGTWQEAVGWCVEVNGRRGGGVREGG